MVSGDFAGKIGDSQKKRQCDVGATVFEGIGTGKIKIGHRNSRMSAVSFRDLVVSFRWEGGEGEGARAGCYRLLVPFHNTSMQGTQQAVILVVAQAIQAEF